MQHHKQISGGIRDRLFLGCRVLEYSGNGKRKHIFQTAVADFCYILFLLYLCQAYKYIFG